MSPHRRRRVRSRNALVVALAALIAVLVALGMAGLDRTRPVAAERVAAVAMPPTPPPPVPPALFADEAPDRARASNALVPLASGPPAPAAPFHYRGTPADLAAAEACLAAAALYEAGDDAPGEQAVAQVVVNRLRHPAFPKTVCGVVFQGAERRTGCQFTFTCDGALARVPSAAAWNRAREIARAALAGFVFKGVGSATHYHADWVVPYWRESLRKLAVVHTQIFYRWPGWWGSPAALIGHAQPGERPGPRVAMLAGLDPAALAGLDPDPDQPAARSLAVAGVPAASLNGSIVRLKDEEGGQFVLQLGAAAAPRTFVITAFNLCGDRENCIVMGWTSAAQVPRALPVLPVAMRSLAFLYRKSSLTGIAQPYWDCTRFPRPLPSQCLSGRR